MITTENMATEAERKALVQLAAKFPHGAAVRHESGTTGTIADDYPGNRHGMGLDTAHALIGDVMAVCVQMSIGVHPITVWYNPAALTVMQAAAPRQRQRTRRAA